MKKEKWLVLGILLSVLIGLGFLKFRGISQRTKEGAMSGEGGASSWLVSKKHTLAAKSDVALRDNKLRQLEQKLARLWEKQLKKYPNLRIEIISLDESEDALWGIYQLGEELEVDEILQIKKSLDDFDASDFDLTKAEAFLAEQESLLNSLKEVLSRPGSSLERIPNGLVSASPVLVFQDLLFLETKVALKNGKEEEALNALRWNQKLAAVFDKAENATFLVQAVGILLDVSYQRTVVENILPQSSPELLEQLTPFLERRDYSPSALAQVYRSELDAIMRNLPSLNLLDSSSNNGGVTPILDGVVRDEALFEAVEAIAQTWSEQIERMEELSIFSRLEGETLHVATPDFEHEEAKFIFESVSAPSEAWVGAFSRATAFSGQTLAAFEIIEREMAGEVFVGKITTKTVNPVTSEPFFFDGDSREVSLDQIYQKEQLPLPSLSLSAESWNNTSFDNESWEGP